jgi:cytochrome c553
LAAAAGLAFCALGQVRAFARAGLVQPQVRLYEIPEATSRFAPADRQQARTLTGVAGDPALMAEGQKIYMQGIPAQNVPACASCHGAAAEGAAAFPRLAGQHSDYLVAQLEGFQSGTRANAPIMTNVVRTMEPQQIKAVATYAASR